MLNFIRTSLKVILFAALVLIIGNLVQWHGKTISDQIKTQMAHAQRLDVISGVKNWTGKTNAKKALVSPNTKNQDLDEDIPASERQKLRALIRELNTSN